MKHLNWRAKLLKLNAQVLLLTLSATIAHADALIPATSEDIDQFDHQIAEQRQRTPEKKPEIKPELKAEAKKENFGKMVSAEAKRLNSEGPEQKKRFGKWVSEQRRRSEQGQNASGDKEFGSSSRSDIPASGAAATGNHGSGNGRGRDKNKH